MSVGRRSVLRAAGFTALAAGVGGGLAACTGTGAAGSTPVNGDPGSSASLRVIPVAERKAAPVLTGPLVDGAPFDLGAWRGSPVVVNVWGSWCGPCNDEQPDLVAAAKALAPRGVKFLGLDQETSRANAQAHQRTYGVTYPSLADPDGTQLLRFRGLIPPASVPTTVVLDTEHRVAAFKIARITKATLLAMVDEVTGR
jgi:thiol-disulfide isomerase/thioredoxin